MTQSSNQKPMGITNDRNQNIPGSTATDVINTTDEVSNLNDRIKADTTPETCRAGLDGD